MKTSSPLKAWFSLKGLLAVLVCSLLVFYFIVVPAITRALENENHNVRMIANGRGIYVAVFSQIANVKRGLYATPNEIPLPMSNTNKLYPELQFDNSTDYFKYLVTNDILPVHWSYLAGPDIRGAPGKYDPDDPRSVDNFKAGNNAWAVVADLSVDDTGTPFLISRNLQETRLLDKYENADRPAVSGPPYDKKRLVVIRMGGSGESMLKKHILWKNLNPNESNNTILRP